MHTHVVLLEMQSILRGGAIVTANTLPTIVRASRAQSTYWAARHYADLGLSVIPCRGKLPGVEWQPYQQRRPSVFQIEQWHVDRKWGNVGIVCGDVSGGLVVIDLDGDKAVEAFKIKFPALAADTYTVTSGSGHGQHIYLYPSILPPTTRVMGCQFGNIELRANGCYVVAPPSIHPTSGAPYTVAIEQPIAHVPDLGDVVTWIKALMKQKHGGVMPPPMAPAAAGIRHASPYAAAALRDEARKVTTARQGWQNNQLNLSAFKMGQLIATGAIDRGQVESALLNAAAACGYIGREGEAPARRTINSGIEGGIKKPQRRS